MADEEFTHTVEAWTVGHLRRALEGLPDDTPVEVDPVEEPGGQLSGDAQVVIDVASGVDGVVYISTDYPSGTYYRMTR